MIHPDKHQYKRDEIKVHGGFSIDEYFSRSQTENRDVLKEILKFCVGNQITEFCNLVETVFQMDNNDWIDIITCRNTMFLSAYLKSKHFREKDALRDLPSALKDDIIVDRITWEEV